jgi:acyl-CoA reductase-like NAD-dependent aldehyde dehydrogenase
MVHGGAEVGAALVEHPGVQHVSFTGSIATGKRIQQSIAASERFKHVSLELGGKSAAIVLEDADLPSAAEHVFQAAFSNVGQNCCAGSRLFVHNNVYDEFLDLLTQRVEEAKLGVEEGCDFGTLVNEAHLDRVRGMLARAVAELGSTTQVIATKNVPSKGYYHPATLLTRVPDNAYIAQTEVFGPVLSVMEPFDDIPTVIQRANSTPFALAGGVFGKTRSDTDRVIHGLNAGIVWVNTWNWIPPWLPFGAGLNSVSGLGKELGTEGLREFSVIKSVYLNQA